MRQLFAASAACAAMLVGTACTSTPADRSEPTDCVPVTSTDLNTEDGWLGLVAQAPDTVSLVAQAPDTVSLVVDDGRGRTVEHRGDEQQVLASAVKVVHLAAYGRAVASGQLDPDELVTLQDWERWYVPGTDGGAHPGALDRLGIANDGYAATDPNTTVRLDDMITAMIQESDNSVPDYLRYRLGGDALVSAAAAGGWNDFVAPSLVTDVLALYDPTLREGDQWATANRWAFDGGFRSEVDAAAQMPSFDDQAKGVQQGFAAASAEQVNSLYRALVDGSFGDGTDVVLRHLEWQPAPEGAVGLGFKGGSLPGVLTQAFELRRDDGTAATAVWLIDGLSADRYDAALAGFGNQQSLIIDALQSTEALDRIACVV